jgi:FeS assembly SUF system regulator
MIRVSRLTDYGVVLMCEMALGGEPSFSARYLSEKTRVSDSAIRKILKLFGKAKLVSSVRGPKGGYMISKKPELIMLLDVVHAIDGPVAVTLCSSHAGAMCKFEHTCAARDGWMSINTILQKTLANISIADFLKEKKYGRTVAH